MPKKKSGILRDEYGYGFCGAGRKGAGDGLQDDSSPPQIFPRNDERTLADAEQLGAVFGGGLTEDFLENAIKMREGLETYLEGDFTDT